VGRFRGFYMFTHFAPLSSRLTAELAEHSIKAAFLLGVNT